MALLFLSADDPAEAWCKALRRHMPALDIRVWPETGDPEEIEVALIWQPPPGELARFPKLKAILSLGAGIDRLLADPTLPDLPLARMVDPSLTRTMGDYVLLAALRHHRRFDCFERAQRERRWDFHLPEPTASKTVGVMGLGELGAHAAGRLAAHGFETVGWSRTARHLAGVTCLAGAEQLDRFLARSEILVCLLPLTAETRGVLNRELFEKLPDGACLINAARGAHLVEADLIAALDRGKLAGATLDVFEAEPLAEESPLWAHSKILITPHVASYCEPETAAEGVAENIRRALAGEPLRHQVDRPRGY
jgi:glyoxylate/hydroxypyruvate reductase A